MLHFFVPPESFKYPKETVIIYCMCCVYLQENVQTELAIAK